MNNCIETNREKNAVESFMAVAEFNGPFLVEPQTLDDNPNLGVWLRDGRDLAALALFQDSFGNWTVLRKDNLKVQQFLHSEVL